MKKRSENLQDIYLTPQEREKDPDYAWKIPPELESQLRRNQIQSALLGLSSIVLIFLLVAMLVREARPKPAAAPTMLITAEDQFIPHYTLPADDLWVIMYENLGSGQALERILGEQPVSTKWIKHVAFHVIMGQQALSVKQYEKATIHLEKVLVVFPEIHGVYGSLGTAYLHLQKFEDAIAPLKKALEEEETFSIVSNLGIALLATQQFELSEKHLLRALALQPKHPGCHKNLALLYQEMERPKQASLYFKKYLSRFPNDFDTLENYSEYLLSLGQRERAAAFLREACTQESADALPLYLLLAKVEAGATNNIQAVDALKNITRYISPNMAIARLHAEEFDTIRNTEAFQNLLHQIELAEVTLENQN